MGGPQGTDCRLTNEPDVGRETRDSVPQRLWTAANCYLDATLERDFTKEAVLAATRKGTQLLLDAGGWLPAVKALRTARAARVGDHLEGALDPGLEGLIPRDLLEYLRHVATDGVHMGYTAARNRVRAKPHASAASNQGEAYEKTWDDAREGRVLLCFADTPGLEGVVASPQGRVEKQNPDRTLSGEGRFVTDMRDRKSTRLNSSHSSVSRMPSSA